MKRANNTHTKIKVLNWIWIKEGDVATSYKERNENDDNRLCAAKVIHFVYLVGENPGNEVVYLIEKMQLLTTFSNK